MLFFAAKKENIVFLRQAEYKKLYKNSQGGQEVELFRFYETKAAETGGSIVMKRRI
jgi:hypothetical protein